ncbi:unnamed protein product [Allacma fusca]|uniref:Uncharacterized protein n=1 Tax=Allacma fusca TaxID=39272 RepID=A0A8J2KIE1_9HEXA|nr:unnamed protein product [Allacma fusca]
MDLKKLPNLKYHIRRNHSNSAFSEVKEDRNVLVEPKGRKGPERLQGKKEKKVVRGKCLNKKNHSNILKTYANLFNMRAKY